MADKQFVGSTRVKTTKYGQDYQFRAERFRPRET